MNIAEIVTEKILAMLESGVAPWRKPWSANNIQYRFTGQAYRGINQLLLALNPHPLPIWLTYRAAQQLGGNVKRGEKGQIIVYYNFPTAEESAAGRKPFLRYSTVFNICQCENVETPSWYKPAAQIVVDAIAAAESIVADYKTAPIVNHGGSQASYNATRDSVSMPIPESFLSMHAYYATLFHEFAHSTGHESRLKRDLKGNMAAESYGKEELIAELTSAILCNASAIDSSAIVEQSAAYLSSWCKALRGDKNLILGAASAAQRAADFILNRVAESESESTTESATV